MLKHLAASLLFATILLLAAVLAPTPAAGASPQADSSNSPAARQFHAWLDNFNSGDRAKFQAFLKENYPEQPRKLTASWDSTRALVAST